MSREEANTAKTGLKISKLFSKQQSELNFKTVNLDSQTITVPDFWPESSSDIIAQFLFPDVITLPNGEESIGESSVVQAIERIVNTWRWWGDSYGYFYRKADAQIFADEMTHILLHQLASPSMLQWQHTGIRFAYNVKGEATPGHVFIDPETNLAQPVRDKYTHPQLYDQLTPTSTPENIAGYSARAQPGSLFVNNTGQAISDATGAFIAPPQTPIISGYLNIAKFFDDISGKFAVDQLTHTVRLLTIALDISMLISSYESNSVAARQQLRTLAITPLGLSELGSESYQQLEGLTKSSFIAQTLARISWEAVATSAELAKVLDQRVADAIFPTWEPMTLVHAPAKEAQALLKKYGQHNYQLTNIHHDENIAKLFDLPRTALEITNQETFGLMANSVTGGIDTNLYQPFVAHHDYIKTKILKPTVINVTELSNQPSLTGVETRTPEEPLAEEDLLEPEETNADQPINLPYQKSSQVSVPPKSPTSELFNYPTSKLGLTSHLLSKQDTYASVTHKFADGHFTILLSQDEQIAEIITTISDLNPDQSAILRLVGELLKGSTYDDKLLGKLERVVEISKHTTLAETLTMFSEWLGD